MEEKYCQSCAMPMGESEEMYGTETNGSKNIDYCKYCYENGEFTSDISMEQMIEFCVPIMTKANADMSADDAKDMMEQYFPTLKRWRLG